MQLTQINNKYELWLPDHRAAREEWKTGWEVARIEAMLSTIKETDIVFDIGTEEGDISALIAKYTLAKIVLIEPNDRVWTCISAIWATNNLPPPLDFFGGFFSSIIKEAPTPSRLPYVPKDLISDHGFKQLYENYPDVAQITLDSYCEKTGIYPTVITMDVEGAEFEVIKGAEKTLKEKKPIIFMSLHPEFMFESYRHNKEWSERIGEEKQYCVQLFRFINECGYKHSVIEWDYHECHLKFTPL